jgi:hypothetical protein
MKEIFPVKELKNSTKIEHLGIEPLKPPPIAIVVDTSSLFLNISVRCLLQTNPHIPFVHEK